MSILIIILIALNVVPGNPDKITLDMRENQIITLERQTDGGWRAREGAKDQGVCYARGCILTVKTNGREETIDFSKTVSVSNNTNWKTLSDINMKGQKFLHISREANRILIIFEAPEVKGQTAEVTWSIGKKGTATPPEGTYSGSPLFVKLLKTQREQKKFLKQLFMSGADLGKYTIKLYAKDSDIYKDYKGSSGLKHEKRQILLYAGADEDKLKFDMAHELSHLITFDLAKRVGYTNVYGRPEKVPVWYVEGIAEFGAIHWSNTKNPGDYWWNDSMTIFRGRVNKGQDPIGILNSAMKKSGWKIDSIEYPAVGTFVEYLYKKCGGSKTLITIWVEAAEGKDINESIEHHTRKSLGSLKQGWKAFLKKNYL